MAERLSYTEDVGCSIHSAGTILEDVMGILDLVRISARESRKIELRFDESQDRSVIVNDVRDVVFSDVR